MDALPDYYGRLGLRSTATQGEVRQAWREQAFRLHPDRNPGSDGQAFAALVEAYGVLSDLEARGRYDRLRSGAQESQRWGERVHREAERYRDARWDAWRAEEQAREQREFERIARELAAERARMYWAEQVDTEAEVWMLGDWTREGRMRDGSLGRLGNRRRRR